jgi:hypothetical protein
MQQVPQQQSGWASADNADLRRENGHVRFQKPALQTKFAASSVLPAPLYLATNGY